MVQAGGSNVNIKEARLVQIYKSGLFQSERLNEVATNL